MSLIDAAAVAAIRQRQAASTQITPMASHPTPEQFHRITHAQWRQSWTSGMQLLTERIKVLRQRDDGVQVAASILYRALDLMSASVGATLDDRLTARTRIPAYADEIAERTWADMADWNQRCLTEAEAEVRAELAAQLDAKQKELDEARAEIAALRAALSPTPEAPTMPTPAPLNELERRWRHVYPGTPAPSPAAMLADLRAWAREHHAPAVAQAAAKRELMAEAA